MGLLGRKGKSQLELAISMETEALLRMVIILFSQWWLRESGEGREHGKTNRRSRGGREGKGGVLEGGGQERFAGQLDSSSRGPRRKRLTFKFF